MQIIHFGVRVNENDPVSVRSALFDKNSITFMAYVKALCGCGQEACLALLRVRRKRRQWPPLLGKILC